MASPIKRSGSLRITVTPDMKARVGALAETLGISPSALAAISIGIYVAQQERALGVAAKVVESITYELGDEVKRQIGLFSSENPDLKS